MWHQGNAEIGGTGLVVDGRDGESVNEGLELVFPQADLAPVVGVTDVYSDAC